MGQSIILARILGPEGRGEFATVILWPTAFAHVGILGVNIALAREAGKNHAAGLSQASLLLALTTSLVSMAICAMALPSLLPPQTRYLLPLCYLFLPFIILNHIALNLQSLDHGAGNFMMVNLSRAILNPAFLLAVVFLWLANLVSLNSLLMALLAANCAVVLFRGFSRLPDFLLPEQHTLSTLPSLFLQGLPFALTSMVDLLYQRIDQFLLVWLLAPRDLGLYTVALSASGVIATIPASTAMVCFTKGAQSLPHQGFSAIASAFRKTALLSLLAGVCLAVMLPFLLPMVFGDAFSKAVPLSMILITGTVISGLCQVLDQALRGQGRPYFGLAGRLVAAMALGIVGFLLSRSWSVIGIAIAFSVAQFIGLAILCCKCTRWYCDAKMNSLLPGSEDLRSMFSKMPEIRFKAP